MICLFSPFTNLFSHLFISIRPHRYLVHTLGYNSTLLDLFCCCKCFTFDYCELFLLVPVLLWHTPINIFWILFLSCLTCWHHKMLWAHRVSYPSNCPRFIFFCLDKRMKEDKSMDLKNIFCLQFSLVLPCVFIKIFF